MPPPKVRWITIPGRPGKIRVVNDEIRTVRRINGRTVITRTAVPKEVTTTKPTAKLSRIYLINKVPVSKSVFDRFNAGKNLPLKTTIIRPKKDVMTPATGLSIADRLARAAPSVFGEKGELKKIEDVFSKQAQMRVKQREQVIKGKLPTVAKLFIAGELTRKEAAAEEKAGIARSMRTRPHILAAEFALAVLASGSYTAAQRAGVFSKVAAKSPTLARAVSKYGTKAIALVYAGGSAVKIMAQPTRSEKLKKIGEIKLDAFAFTTGSIAGAALVNDPSKFIVKGKKGAFTYNPRTKKRSRVDLLAQTKKQLAKLKGKEIVLEKGESLPKPPKGFVWKRFQEYTGKLALVQGGSKDFNIQSFKLTKGKAIGIPPERLIAATKAQAILNIQKVVKVSKPVLQSLSKKQLLLFVSLSKGKQKEIAKQAQKQAQKATTKTKQKQKFKIAIATLTSQAVKQKQKVKIKVKVKVKVKTKVKVKEKVKVKVKEKLKVKDKVRVKVKRKVDFPGHPPPPFLFIPFLPPKVRERLKRGSKVRITKQSLKYLPSLKGLFQYTRRGRTISKAQAIRLAKRGFTGLEVRWVVAKKKKKKIKIIIRRRRKITASQRRILLARLKKARAARRRMRR